MEEIELVNGLKIQAEMMDEGVNKADDYFDFDKYETGWHETKRNMYHVTAIISCLKQLFRNEKYNYKPPLEIRGSWFIGNMLHEEAQEHKQKIDGYYVKEFPLNVEVQVKNKEFLLNIPVEDQIIYIVGKIDLLHTQKRRVEDLKTFMHWYMPKYAKDVDIKYYIQVIIYTFIANHTYMEKEPIEDIYIVCISKKNCLTKIVKIKYDEDIGLKLYEWLVKRAIKYHYQLSNDIEPKGEPTKYCQWGEYIENCMEGREFLKEILAPITLESRLFDQTYKGKKKAYWKYDKEKKFWIETKLFVAFKAELLKTKNQKTL